jgi:hypothetical protein
VDGVLLLNEVVDLAKRSKRECLILEVDFEKAYDSVDSGLLKYMTNKVGMDEKWVRWMKACVFGGNTSILVSRSLTEEINVQRGLKQGDPLAPFLFLLVAVDFSGLVNVPRVFMDVACGFLHCKEGTITFKYLGLPVEANPKEVSTWEPM